MTWAHDSPQANDTSRNKAACIFECIRLCHCRFEYGCSSVKNSGETQQRIGWQSENAKPFNNYHLTFWLSPSAYLARNSLKRATQENVDANKAACWHFTQYDVFSTCIHLSRAAKSAEIRLCLCLQGQDLCRDLCLVTLHHFPQKGHWDIFHLDMPTGCGQRLPGALLSITSAPDGEVCLVMASMEPILFP